MRLNRSLALLLLAPFAAVMCSPATDQGTIAILTVDDPFAGPPPATEITVQGIAYDDAGSASTTTTLAEAPYNVDGGGSINLGTYDESTTESLRVTATDQAGTTVAWGESLPVELGAVAGVSLGVFVQRAGALSRMPTPLSDGRPAPLLSIVGGRYILVAGGTESSLAAQTNLYDLVSWAPLASPPVLPVTPASAVLAAPGGNIQVLAISATAAQWYNLTDAETSDASAPTSGTGNWADVAGGATITSTDGSVSFVVGGTRTSGAPTTAVLVVQWGGAISWANFVAPRLGATAAWIDPIGLVIEGGNVPSTGDAAPPPGVEYLAGGTGVPLDYPADTTFGAGMALLGAAGSHWSSVLLVGGASESVGGSAARVLSVPCGGSSYPACSATPWEAALPTPLVATQVFGLDSATAFVVGDDANGATHAYTMSATTVTEVPFRVPRTQARALRLPIGPRGAGPIALVGGDADAGGNTGYIESFIPVQSN